MPHTHTLCYSVLILSHIHCGLIMYTIIMVSHFGSKYHLETHTNQDLPMVYVEVITYSDISPY